MTNKILAKFFYENRNTKKITLPNRITESTTQPKNKTEHSNKFPQRPSYVEPSLAPYLNPKVSIMSTNNVSIQTKTFHNSSTADNRIAIEHTHTKECILKAKLGHLIESPPHSAPLICVFSSAFLPVLTPWDLTLRANILRDLFFSTSVYVVFFRAFPFIKLISFETVPRCILLSHDIESNEGKACIFLQRKLNQNEISFCEIGRRFKNKNSVIFLGFCVCFIKMWWFFVEIKRKWFMYFFNILFTIFLF